MAEFVKKGGKGAVGTLIKAEKFLGSGAEILETAIPDDLDALIVQVKDSHRAAVGQAGRAVIIAARAGQLLLAAKTKLPKGKPFTEWLAETFDFSQRLAYNYMKVSEAMSRRAGEIEKCQSIAEVLKLCENTTDDGGKKKKKDPKRESVITFLAKVERWYADEIAATPLEDWDKDRRETLKRAFTGVARIHADL